jgi:S-adenosylmethionine decarboxylase
LDDLNAGNGGVDRPTTRFGLHLTVDGYDGAPELLADIGVVQRWLDELPRRLGMTKLLEPCLIEVGTQNEKDPGGITGFVLIAQSHISVHTFPLRRFVTADVFTCQDHLDADQVRESLAAIFGLGEIESHLLQRGTRYPLYNFRETIPARPRTEETQHHGASK